MELASFSTTIIIQALGWTVVHSFWQILVVFTLFKLGAWFINRNNRVQYGWALTTMGMVAIWSAFTFLHEFDRLQIQEDARGTAQNSAILTSLSPGDAAEPVSITPVQIIQEPSLTIKVMEWIERYSIWFGWAWFIGALIQSVQMLGGYWLSQRLRWRGVSAPRADFVELCNQLAAKTGISRAVQLLDSHFVEEPLTLGFWKPVILFPAGMLLELSPAQVEALLLHELAHIRRYDYLVNLFQVLLERCFFYHPMFWLISREAHTHREFCCDDMVVRHTQNPLLYAHTLTALKLSTVHTKNAFVMKSSGKHSFSARILRLAGVTPKRSNRANFLLFFMLFGILLTGLFKPAQTQAAVDAAFDAIALKATEVQLVMPDSIAPRKAAKSVQKNMPVNAENGAQPESESVGNVAVELNKMNVFYVGVDNPVEVAVNGIPVNQLSVKLIGGGKIVGANGTYIATFTEPGHVQLEVSRNQNGQQKLLSTKSFRVKRIPDPAPRFGGMPSGPITVDKLQELKNVAVLALLQNFDFDASCEVVHFDLTVLPKGLDPVSMNISGAVLTSDAIERLSVLTPGGAFFIDDIYVKCPGDKEPRNIGGLAFKVREKE
jgi:beta-lactamase regulating signal transducer with metallopeptidase domain